MEVENVALAVQRSAHPELGELIDKIQEYLNNKLYKQLTDALIEYAKKPCFSSGVELVALFDETIKPLETKLNPLSFIQLLAAAAKQKTPEEALEYIEPYGEKDVVKKDSDAKCFWTTTKAAKLTLTGKTKEAKEQLEIVEKILDDQLGLELPVRSYYHQTAAAYHKTMDEKRNYYKSLMMYLSYTKVSAIPEDERMPLAFNVAVAALVAEKEFDFGELLQQDLMVALKEGGPEDKKWILDFLEAFCEGKFDLFDAAMKNHAARLSACPELKAAEPDLKKKMTQLALMEMVFQRPKKERVVAFADIAKHCRVGAKEVEYLLMRTMNEELCRGVIDEVDQVCTFSWVKPRILDNNRIIIMRDRIDDWATQAKNLMSTLEEMTPELMVS